VSSVVNLHKNKLEVKLCYNFQDNEEPKSVGYVKSPPIQTQVFLEPRGFRASITVNISALSSQHEDALFRILVTAHHEEKGKCGQVASHPIRVVSKPTFNKWKESNSTSKKRESLLNTENLRKKRCLVSSKLDQSVVQLQDSGVDDFETTFQRLVVCYNNLSPEDRLSKSRRVLENFKEGNKFVSDFIQLFANQPTSLEDDTTFIALPTVANHVPEQISEELFPNQELNSFETFLQQSVFPEVW